MQWGTDGLLVWPIITSISIISLERSMWKQMHCSRIDWGKADKTHPADSILDIVTAALTGQGNDYIDTIPCSPHAIESFVSSIHDNPQVVCKSMTTSETEPDSDSYSCPDPSWNLKCIDQSGQRTQAEDQVISDLIKQYKARELHKGIDTDSLEMKQFLKQRGKLLLRNGILYHKNDTKETECPDRNSMQSILPISLRMQALRGCHDDLGHLGIERTLDLLRDQFYWPNMTEDMTRHIRQCERCLQFKVSPDRAPMEMLIQHILWN